MSEVKSGTKINVKNISKKNLNLANGAIKAGEEGVATIAEVQCLSKYLNEIGGEVPLNAAEKKAIKRKETLAGKMATKPVVKTVVKKTTRKTESNSLI